MAKTTGTLSINSENMLPIIKKWLYSDHDIFVREQVSNACDAITKLKKLEAVGEYAPEKPLEPKISVIVNPDDKTLKFVDNGIGMTSDEVVEYITQIAFSGATEFLEKYKGKTDEDQIIGHFGLGFYSAFMVADEVHIDTLSYKEGAEAVHWESDGTSEYTIEEGDRTAAGTEITLFLNDDSLEFCNEFRMREVLQKYCSFMPYPIYLTDEGKAAVKRREEEAKRIREENEKAAKEAAEKGEDAPEPKAVPEIRMINDIHPLWTKMPSECKDDEYREFYRNVFHDYKEPLFWIHLNMDYPFNLRGILYFPKINMEYDALDSSIKLYNNQVFIADNIKEVIPEFLMTLKGVIDCPELPLNVSRSALQNDGFVKKISDYISKKTADKLSGLCKTQREEYEKYWDDISPFIKYGCIRDTKFADKMMDYILFKDLDDKYLTLAEYKEKNNIADPKKEEQKDVAAQDAGEAAADETAAEASEARDAEEKDTRSTVYYVTDEVQQAQYITMFRNRKKDAVILHHNIDSAFITQLEQRNENLKFARIDSELDEAFRSGEEVNDDEKNALQEIFRKHLGMDKLTVQAENMEDEGIAAIITLSEESRRMQDMMKMYGMGGSDDAEMFGASRTLVLNASHPLVKFVLEHRRAQSVPVICRQLYDLAMISHRALTQEEMQAFIKRSNEIMMLLTK